MNERIALGFHTCVDYELKWDTQVVEAQIKAFDIHADELKLDIEAGKYLPREEHETDLAARAVFFAQQVENFAYLVAPKIILALGADESKTHELLALLQAETATWLDAYARDRVFHVELPETGDDAGGQTN